MESGKCENEDCHQEETANGNNSEETRTCDAELTRSGDLESTLATSPLLHRRSFNWCRVVFPRHRFCRPNVRGQAWRGKNVRHGTTAYPRRCLHHACWAPFLFRYESSLEVTRDSQADTYEQRDVSAHP